MVDDSECDVCSELVREAVRMQRREMEAEETKPAAVARQCGPCNWSKKDELAILKVLVEFKKDGGNVFKISGSWLKGAVKGKLDGDFSEKQLQRKVRRAGGNFKKNLKPTAVLCNHESRVYEM